MNNKENKSCGRCHENKGVKCDVENCVYHDRECCCTAEYIQVGPHSASSSKDTTCVTFRPKDIG